MGVYLKGPVINNAAILNIPDWQTCGTRCNDEPDCVAFGYTAGNKRCYLISRVTDDKVPYGGSNGPAYTAWKGCPGKTRVNILAKNPNFFPLLNTIIANFFLVFVHWKISKW